MLDFTLKVTSISTETRDGSTASTAQNLKVTVNAVADKPTLTTQAATGDEDTAIALNIQSTLSDTDGSESNHLIISQVPIGATLNQGIRQSDGTWRLTPAELTGLTITPPTNSDADFTLKVTSISTEARDGSTASTEQDLIVTVNAIADTPTLTTQSATGDEDTEIALNIQSTLNDTDGSETNHLIISQVPVGAKLTQGIRQSDGTWRLDPADLDDLKVISPLNSDADFTLKVTSISTEARDGSTASTEQDLIVTVNAIADTPTLTTQSATGDEDTAIALNIQSTLNDDDGSETNHLIISQVPTGATLNKGTERSDGTWRLTPAELNNLTITPPLNSDVDFTLKVTSISTETRDGSTASTEQDLIVTVNAVADAPTLTTQSAQGDEDTEIALNIQSTLNDNDLSETNHLIISQVPLGATLNQGIRQSDGTWRLTPAELTGLTITPPLNSDTDFALKITSISEEIGEDDKILSTAKTEKMLSVKVDAIADKPTLTTQSATGDEDTAISLNIQSTLNDDDGSETNHLIISQVPAGANI